MEEKNKVKYVELVFENCEVAKLDVNMFKYFYMSGIHDTLSVNCFQYEKGEWSKHLGCDYFHIQILPEGLKQVLTMEQVTLKERLERHSDITCVDVTYEDGTEESYYVPWPDDEEFTNTYQTITNAGTDDAMDITISKENNLYEEMV